jgi:transposase InsO family protein
VIDVYARYIVGWRVSRTAHASFVLDALEQAITTAGPFTAAAWFITATADPIRVHQVHRTPRRSGHRTSVGSVGDSYDNALAETINGLYKAEVIHRQGPWRSFEAVELPRSNGWTGSTIGGSRTHRKHPAGRSRAAISC